MTLSGYDDGQVKGFRCHRGRLNWRREVTGLHRQCHWGVFEEQMQHQARWDGQDLDGQWA